MNYSIIKLLPQHIQDMMENLDEQRMREIRIRINNPVLIRYGKNEFILQNEKREKYFATKKDVYEIMGHISHHSLYAYEEEMKQGFVTVEGGHRIGICGQVILENGKVKNMKHISALHIRVAHEIIGCSDYIMPWIVNEHSIYNTLIVSPPGCGKTTLLRDMIRQLSDGNSMISGHTVAVVDERSEIAGCYHGIAQNHMGVRTDVIDGCPKSVGMFMMLRTMGPEIIAVDEIGGNEELSALQYACNCGVKIIATIHGNSYRDFRDRSKKHELLSERTFQRIIVLCGLGQIKGVYDSKGNRVDTL